MVNHERSDDTSSDHSYPCSYEFQPRDKRRREDEIIISDSETNCASEESIEHTKHEDEEVSHNDMEVDKEKCDEEDDLCVLKDALEVAVRSFQGLSQHQKNLMFQNLKNLGPETRKELTDGWKELSSEVLRLNAKTQTFFAKFVNAGV